MVISEIIARSPRPESLVWVIKKQTVKPAVIGGLNIRLYKP